MPSLQAAIIAARALLKRRLSPGHLPPPSDPAPLGLEAQSSQIQELIVKALDKRMHEPFLLVGSRGTGKSLCLEHAFARLRERYRVQGKLRPFRVVYVNGRMESTDVGAISEIAAQLEMSKTLDTSKRRSTGGSAAGGRGGGRGARNQLDFVVEGMRSGTFEETPLVFVIDNIEEFARRGGRGGGGGGAGGGGKQLLLYSLMDLQHRDDLQFVVLGVSAELDVLDRFEKRIRSRISNKQIFFPPAQPLASVILPIFDQALHLPEDPPSSYPSLSSSFDHSSSDIVEVQRRYARAFNNAWAALRPSLPPLLEWPQKLGRPLRWFTTLAYRAVTNLDSETPFLTLAHFNEALKMQAPHTTAASRGGFATLANLELLVVIAMKRLVDRGKEKCTLDMIWKEYEAFLKQEPLLPCRYSRPVLHKGLLNVLALGLACVCHRVPPGGKSYLEQCPLPPDKDFGSLDAADLGSAPLCITFYPQDLHDFLVAQEHALPTLLTRWGSSWTE